MCFTSSPKCIEHGMVEPFYALCNNKQRLQRHHGKIDNLAIPDTARHPELPAVSAESSSGQDGPGAEGRVGPRDDAEENLTDLARRAGPAHARPAAPKVPLPLFQEGGTDSRRAGPAHARPAAA